MSTPFIMANLSSFFKIYSFKSSRKQIRFILLRLKQVFIKTSYYLYTMQFVQIIHFFNEYEHDNHFKNC